MSSGRPRDWGREQPRRAPRYDAGPPGPPPSGQLRCPNCRQFAADTELACPACGFPFTCDISPVATTLQRSTMALWRVVLAITAFLFVLTSGVFYHSGYQEYHGLTQATVVKLDASAVAGEVPVIGPEVFVFRTQLALALVKQRAPELFWRFQDGAASVEFFSASSLDTGSGQAPLEHIGALAEPATGRIMVLTTTAFPSGTGELWDRDVFIYAGILVHELRHLELHNMGTAPGGWEEEALCEQAAYAALVKLQAPPALLARYEAYLANPTDARYQRWYDWYNNWE